MGAEETNGDGFGVGWYGDRESAAVFRSIEPAWNDRNLRALSAHITSGLVFAHIRASTGSPVQQTNCHPFQHGRWLWMHNGLIREYHAVKRDLTLAVSPGRYPDIEGTTDSEVMFHLALTFGLEEDPPAAVARVIGLVEQVGREHGVEHPFQGRSRRPTVSASGPSGTRASGSPDPSSTARTFARCGPCIRRTSSSERWGTRRGSSCPSPSAMRSRAHGMRYRSRHTE